MSRSWWLKSALVIFLVLLALVGLVPTYVELIAYPENIDPNRDALDEAAQAEGDEGVEGAQGLVLDEERRDPALPSWYVWYQDKITDKALTLGLDLQGGLLLRYSVDIDSAIDDKLARFGSDIKSAMNAKGVSVDYRVLRDEDRLSFTFGAASETGRVNDEFMRDFPVLSIVGRSGAEVVLGLRENYLQETEEFAVKQAVEIIRERIDALGVASPSVRVEGGRHVVVELPGLSSRRAAAAEKLISTTAVLTFKLVADASEAMQLFTAWGAELAADGPIKLEGGTLVATDELTPAGRLRVSGRDVLKEYVMTKRDHIPQQREVVYERVDRRGQRDEAAKGPSQWRLRLVRTDLPVLTGDNVDDAYPASNPNTNIPYVSLKLDRSGGDLFYDITKAHVGDQLAILMDDTLVSDPVIRSEIPGGNVSIEMGGTNRQQILEDVQNLVVSLRSGALPAPIRQEFKTLVGPSLGRDSIERGTRALLIGFALIVIFMLVYYRLGGFVANVALGMNVLFILAIMAGLGAALTLPGIAGIVLTIGMAVDANVIIFERVREELRAGETPRKALQNGYDRALWTILDANITTAIAALVLMEFGSGPVRGFAVTLLIGIVCSVFTAFFVTRLIFDWYIAREKVERLPI